MPAAHTRHDFLPCPSASQSETEWSLAVENKLRVRSGQSCSVLSLDPGRASFGQLLLLPLSCFDGEVMRQSCQLSCQLHTLSQRPNVSCSGSSGDGFRTSRVELLISWEVDAKISINCLKLWVPCELQRVKQASICGTVERIISVTEFDSQAFVSRRHLNTPTALPALSTTTGALGSSLCKEKEQNQKLFVAATAAYVKSVEASRCSCWSPSIDH